MGPLQAGCRGGAAVAIAALVPAGDGGHNAGDGINAADRIVFCVHDDNVVVMVAADGLGRPPGGGQGGTAVAAVAPLTGAGKGGHDAVGIHFADAVALALADVGVPLTIHADRSGPHDGGPGGRLTIPGPALLPIASEGRDDAGLQVQAAYALILNIRDEQAAFAIQEAIVRLPQLRQHTGATVATVPWDTSPGHRGDDTGGGIDFADSGIQPVHDVDVPVGIHIERVQVIQCRFCGRAAVTRVALTTAAGNGGDNPGILVDTADGVGAPVGNIQVAGSVEGTPIGFADQCLSGRATVAGVASLASPDYCLNDANRKSHALVLPYHGAGGAFGQTARL